MKNTDYPISVYWSEEDQAYLAEVPDLPGCIIDGQTQEEAVSNAREAILDWLHMNESLGAKPPEVLDYSQTKAKHAKLSEEFVRETVIQLVPEIVSQVLGKVANRLPTIPAGNRGDVGLFKR